MTQDGRVAAFQYCMHTNEKEDSKGEDTVVVVLDEKAPEPQ